MILGSRGPRALFKNACAVAAVMGLALTLVAFLVPGPIQREAYMGAEYCGSCHQEQYKAWSSSGHAQAFVHLPEQSKNDRACLSCHATGVFEKSEPIFAGVQCESCHGPGQYYAALHIKKDAVLSKLLFKQERNCLHCHSQDEKLGAASTSSIKFDHARSR